MLANYLFRCFFQLQKFFGCLSLGCHVFVLFIGAKWLNIWSFKVLLSDVDHPATLQKLKRWLRLLRCRMLLSQSSCFIVPLLANLMFLRELIAEQVYKLDGALLWWVWHFTHLLLLYLFNLCLEVIINNQLILCTGHKHPLKSTNPYSWVPIFTALLSDQLLGITSVDAQSLRCNLPW